MNALYPAKQVIKREIPSQGYWKCRVNHVDMLSSPFISICSSQPCAAFSRSLNLNLFQPNFFFALFLLFLFLLKISSHPQTLTVVCYSWFFYHSKEYLRKKIFKLLFKMCLECSFTQKSAGFLGTISAPSDFVCPSSVFSPSDLKSCAVQVSLL